MLNRFFNSQTKTVTFAAVVLASSALLSRLLGLVRDRLLAGRFGAGQELDIYFAAFRIPDFIYGILIMGGIAAVFLPVFSEYYKKNEVEAWRFVNNLLNTFLFLLILLCSILALLTPFLIDIVAPGFSPEKKDLAVDLTRIMFLSPIFFGLSSLFSGVLHYFNRFLVYSLSPILYNLGIISGILFLVPVFGLPGLAYGVILGAACHWLFQVPAAIASGYKYQPVFNFKSSGIAKVFRLMIPRTVGAAAYHLNLIVITAIASTLTAGSIAVFNFSNNLQYFPIGIIGASFAIAAFPALSRTWAAGQKDEFSETFSSTFRQILFLIIPVSLLIFILRAQIVRVILGTGEFGWSETRLTAASLGLFCLGIFAYAFIPFLARVFYSFQDTRTPVVIGLVSMLLNVVLSFLFVSLLSCPNAFQEFMTGVLKLEGIRGLSVIGLPLALSISGIFQFSLLLCFLKKKTQDLRFREIWDSAGRVLLTSLFMAGASYLTLRLGNVFLDTNTFLGIFFQAIIAGAIGIAVYAAFNFLLKSPELKAIKYSFLKQFKKTNEKNS
jgi:putative peptidoglycan lipid II flippase